MSYKNLFSTTSDELSTGDWMMCSVKALVVRPGYYRLYRCIPFLGNTQDEPMGVRITPIAKEREVAKVLFPAALYGMKADDL